MIAEDDVQFGATNVDPATPAAGQSRSGSAFDAELDRLFLSGRVRNFHPFAFQQGLLNDQADAGIRLSSSSRQTLNYNGQRPCNIVQPNC